MQACVLYHPGNRNVEKLAKIIAERCGVKATDISQKHPVPDAQLLFIGLSVQHGRQDLVMMDYLDKLPTNFVRGAALFSSHHKGEDRTEQVVNLLNHKGIDVFPDTYVFKESGFGIFKNKIDASDAEEATAFADTVIEAVISK